jgi:hypothetical protein
MVPQRGMDSVMPFVDQFPTHPKVVVKPSYSSMDQKVLRFSHEARSWQRMGQHGWLNVSVAIARVLRDKGYRIWGEE